MKNGSRIRVLGISASLRNARRGKGNTILVEDLLHIQTKEDLINYLRSQTAMHIHNFMEAGRKDRIPFDVLYKNLRRQKGTSGLSNSETALAAALWAASKLNCDIDHVSLTEYFPENESRSGVKLDELKEKILLADGIIVSTPVYFGDRGSLSQSLFTMIRNDPDFISKLKYKVYAGIAVGAKRNGGQETTLIYQLWDMLQCGLLGVGNDSETTSQYGGTGHAGDIGAMQEDVYGMETCIGTGRRIARVSEMVKTGKEHTLKRKIIVTFWILQDRNSFALNYIKDLSKRLPDFVEPHIFDIASMNLFRCLACDICPTDIGIDEIYRCVIKHKRDEMGDQHPKIIIGDAIVPVYYSCHERSGILRNYQKFIERTRYLRRSDYILSDSVFAPLVLEEIGASENIQVRMLTSLIRHHTVASAPNTIYLQDGKYLNKETTEKKFFEFIESVKYVSSGKIIINSESVDHLKYNPVGYIFSKEKDRQDEEKNKRDKVIDERRKKFRNILKNNSKMKDNK